MNKWFALTLLLASVLLYSLQQEVIGLGRIPVPKGWPQPVYDKPITEAGFELGKRLFYDPNLSRDGTISCANCHLSFTGFTHVDHKVSHGIEGRIGTRNAPVLINLAWNSTFHWDGGVNHLEMQALNPIQHVSEMDNSLDNVVAYLNTSSEYKAMFYTAFRDSTATTSNMLRAFGQFTASLVSSNSKYDQVKRKEMKFTSQEKQGYRLFQKNCADCHREPLTNANFFASNGLPLDTLYNDLGRFSITQNPKDSLQFRVPTLRNIEFTQPYMHDGRFQTLREVIDHYTKIDPATPHLHPLLKKAIELSDEDQKDLISFLKTLTDKEFLYNPRFRP